ncbi:unnamed protein product [Didymodactylos carnosus]|uniref:NHL repeat containing protein n=1 Tax=Didymodactylos carnosus TaxID=1234261 RepID=A0A814Y3W7_9BILA|nr:unnamed protein product [Didymodactylos carnosus]CAF3987117.1 unnamed protein product [Didymodactylos carnosus]
MTSTTQPVTPTTQPVTSTTQPATSTTQSLASTTHPTVSTTPPTTSPTQPATSRTQSATSTTQPATTTTQPATSTTQPATSTPQPATSTTQSATPTTQPATSTTQPATSTKQPTTSTPQPATSTTQSATSTTQPATSTTQPATSTPQPTTSTTQSATSTTQPATSTTQPVTSTTQPATSTTQPATSTSTTHPATTTCVGSWNPTASLQYGTGTAGNASNQFNYPVDIFIDSSDNLYVADNDNGRIQKFAMSSTMATTVAGGQGGGTNSNQLKNAAGVFVNSAYIYVSDVQAGIGTRIQRFPYNSVSGTAATTVAGASGFNGAATDIIGNCWSLYVDSSNNVFETDFTNCRVLEFPSGSTSGSYGTLIAGDSTCANSSTELNAPHAITPDSANTVFYIADNSNNRIQVCPQSGSGACSTLVGAPTINAPYDVELARDGNLYVVENTQVLRFPGASATGSAVLSSLNGAIAIAFDSQMNMYIAEWTQQRVLRFDYIC